MKASELRIGNWVNVKRYPYENAPYKIDSLHGDNTFTFRFESEIKGCFHTSIIYPIPLTEEWLLKFGFVNDGPLGITSMVLGYSKGVLNIAFKEGNVIYVGHGVQRINSDRIKHVHQLQNLYHALTGEELSLSE